MWLRLRQICLVAEKLAPVEEALCDVFGVKVCYNDSGVGQFGLENALFPFGNQMLEVVAPVEEGTTGGRYLERRGGDGGYMFITQCDDFAPRSKRVEELGIRLAHHFERPEFLNMQMHPKDTGVTFFEIDEQIGPDAHELDGAWMPASVGWQEYKCTDRVSGFAAAELQCDDPQKSAKLWSEISEIALTEENGHPTLVLDNAKARFVPCTDGRPEGLGGLDIATTDKAAILAAAEARGLVTGENQVSICGMRLNLV